MNGGPAALAPAPAPRSGEFLAPLPLAAVALMVVNDAWLKPAYPSALTGKLSDVAICFLLPLFVSELLGLWLGLAPRRRLAIGAGATVAIFTALKAAPPFARLAASALSALGPAIGIDRPFRITADPTDLVCLALIPAALAYGRRRLRPTRSSDTPSAPAPSTA